MICPPGFFNPATIVPGFQSLDHWLPAANAEALRILTRSVASPRHEIWVANIGTFVGASVAVIANAACQVDSWAIIRCVDTWKGSSGADRINDLYAEHHVREVFDQNFCTDVFGRSTRILPHEMSSLAAASSPAFDRKFDLVFLDADHSYEAVSADIDAWKSKLRPGGILCGDDYGVFEGVTRAVNELGFCGLIGNVWFRIQGLE